MPLLLSIGFLLLSSWLFLDVLLFIPSNLLNSLKPFSSLTLVVVVLFVLWCFEE